MSACGEVNGVPSSTSSSPPIKNGAAIAVAPKPVRAALPRSNLPPLDIKGESIPSKANLPFGPIEPKPKLAPKLARLKPPAVFFKNGKDLPKNVPPPSP